MAVAINDVSKKLHLIVRGNSRLSIYNLTKWIEVESDKEQYDFKIQLRSVNMIKSIIE